MFLADCWIKCGDNDLESIYVNSLFFNFECAIMQPVRLWGQDLDRTAPAVVRPLLTRLRKLLKLKFILLFYQLHGNPQENVLTKLQKENIFFLFRFPSESAGICRSYRKYNHYYLAESGNELRCNERTNSIFLVIYQNCILF